MAELRVSEAVCEAFGGLRIAAIVADGFAGREPWPEVDAALTALEAAAAGGDTLPAAAPPWTPPPPTWRRGWGPVRSG
jgi:hypothetical protein